MQGSNHVFYEDVGESQEAIFVLKIGIDLSEVTEPGSYGYIRLSFDNEKSARKFDLLRVEHNLSYLRPRYFNLTNLPPVIISY